MFTSAAAGDRTPPYSYYPCVYDYNGYQPVGDLADQPPQTPDYAATSQPPESKRAAGVDGWVMFTFALAAVLAVAGGIIMNRHARRLGAR